MRSDVALTIDDDVRGGDGDGEFMAGRQIPRRIDDDDTEQAQFGPQGKLGPLSEVDLFDDDSS